MKGETPSAFEMLGIDDLGSFSRRARDEIERLADCVAEVLESLDSPTWAAKALLRASPEIDLGGRKPGPDVYDPRWGIWEHAHELLERDLGELDRTMEGVLERAVEERGARLLEGIAGRFLGSGSEDIARRAAELAAEIAKRAISSERHGTYGGEPSSLDSISELVGSIVRDVFGRRRSS